jgi:ferric-dicitrate binding protein FerR (iron transport regulator)
MDNDTFLLLTARKLSAEASAEDLESLEKLLNQDESLKKRYELLRVYWENKNIVAADVHDALEKVLHRIQNDKTENDYPDLNPRPQRKRAIEVLLQFSKVAAVIAVTLVSIYFFNRKTPVRQVAKLAAKDTLQTLQTPKGKKTAITLSDGTKVIMNADSRLTFPQKFTGNTREVTLAGEAFFDVTHKAKVPFIIHTDKISIKVLGTEFNVRSYPGDSTTETTLIHGMIEVTLNDRPDDRIVLKPKEKLVVSNSAAEKNSSAIKTVPATHAAELLISNLHYIPGSDSAAVETSWVNNKLIFQDEAFGKLAEELGRKYDVSIEFKNDEIKNYRFTGIFENESITQALDALRLTEKFNYKMNGTTIIIY